MEIFLKILKACLFNQEWMRKLIMNNIKLRVVEIIAGLIVLILVTVCNGINTTRLIKLDKLH